MQVIDFFDRGLGLGNDAPCLRDATRTLTYGEVADASHRIANGLAAAGVGASTQVGLLAQNHLLTMVAVLGILRSDGVWLPVNARNAQEENANILSRGGCEFLFVHSAFEPQLALLRREMPELKGIVCIDRALDGVPSLEEWMAQQSAAPFRSSATADDLVAIRGTGGTTGLPKGVLVTHRMFATCFANWFALMPVERPPVHLAVAPLTHAAGYMAIATMAWGGVTVVLERAGPASILAAIEQHRVTQLFLPPTVIYRLLAAPELGRFDTRSLQYFIYSAAPMSVDKLREALAAFGPVMVQCYGQAEAPFLCTCLTARDHADILADDRLLARLASCGRATPFVRLAVMGSDGALLPTGERGELVVQGDLVMKGYFRDPEKTAATLAGGWLHTGDVGYRDADGYFYIVDRLKDLIVSGGFNIAPSEIEQVLWAMPEVADCAVIGVPDDTWGESVKAVVELKPGAAWNEQDALRFCRDRLGGMKAPKSIEVWASLPRSAVGKVLKRDIRERFWTGRQRRV